MLWFKKPKKLNETTRLYALYGESANLSFLDSAIKDNNSKIDTNANNIETNRNNIAANANRIEEVNNKIDNLPSVDLTEVNNRINTNTRNIATNVTNINNLNTKVNNITNDLSNVAKLNQPNTFTAEIKMLDKINMSGYKLYNIPEPTDNWDPTSKSYVDNKFNGVGRLSSANNWGAQNTFNSGIQLGSHLKAGWGSGIFNITPEDNTNKTIKFSKQNFGRFNLDLENATKILNVPNPTSNGEVANKQYVDNKFNTIPGTYKTISTGQLIQRGEYIIKEIIPTQGSGRLYAYGFDIYGRFATADRILSGFKPNSRYKCSTFIDRIQEGGSWREIWIDRPEHEVILTSDNSGNINTSGVEFYGMPYHSFYITNKDWNITQVKWNYILRLID